MFALAAWQWVGAAAATSATGVASAAGAKALLRWLGRALANTISDAIKETTQPQLAAVEQRLIDEITAVGVAGSAEHNAVVTRVSILEGRVTAVELRLPAVPPTAPEGG